MPKKERFTENPFPELLLTDMEVAHLQDLALHIADEHMQKYEAFVTHNRQVDSRRWKFVKGKGNLRTFAERPSGKSSGNTKGPITEDRESAIMKNSVHAIDPKLTVILQVGTIAGDLDDCMFGIINPTLEIMRLKASYVGDLSGAAILKTIIAPTLDDPFHSLVIKWMEIDLPLQSTKLVKKRDFVYMEATGFRISAVTGQRIGYHLLHSLTFPETHPIPPRIRANYACCGLFGQMDENVVEIFGTGIVNPGGEMFKFLSVPVAANALLSGSKYIYCGEMKKLAWYLQKRLTLSQEVVDGHKCTTCKKKTSRGLLGASVCKLCYHSVCYSCKIRKKLSFLTPDNRLFRRKITFCQECVTTAMKASAVDAARDEIMGYATASVFDNSLLGSDSESTMSYSTISESGSEQSWYR